MSDLTSRIIQFEDEGMEPLEEIKLFQDLVNSGLAYELQGSYVRMARGMIANGLITGPGEPDPDFDSEEYTSL